MATMIQNKKRQFAILMERDEDGYYVASVPALPGCHTQARTLSELRKRVREAILLCTKVARTNVAYAKKIRTLQAQPMFVGVELVEV